MANKWLPLVGLTTGHFINDFYQSLMPLLLPFLIPEFKLSVFSGGVLIAIYIAVTVVMNPLIAHLTDVHGHRKLVLCLGLGLFSILTSTLRFADSYLGVILVSLAMGVSFSAYHPQAIKFVHSYYEKRMGRAMGFHGIGGGAGFAATPILLVPLMYAIGWRGAISFIFIPGVIVAAALWFILKEPEAESRAPLPSIEVRPLLILSVIAGLSSFVFRGFITFLPLYFVARDTGVVEMGLLIGLVQGTGIIAEPLGGTLSDTMGRRKIYMISLVMLMVSIFTFTNTDGPISLLWLLLIRFWAQAHMPVGLTMACELGPPERAGTCSGIVFGGSMALGLIATLVVGYLIDVVGFYWSFMSLALFAGAAAILTLILPFGTSKKPR